MWQVSWTDKDDSVGWQAYYHERNRLITALLHSPFDKGGRVLLESLFLDVKHTLSMQYYTEAGRLMALEDLLSGPDHLHPSLSQRLPVIRAMAKEYPESQVKPNVDDFPAIQTKKPPFRGRRSFASPRLQETCFLDREDCCSSAVQAGERRGEGSPADSAELR